MITEKRFQDMTLHQWLFHYHEVMRERQREAKEKRSILDIIVSYLELIVSASNPEMGQKLSALKKLKEAQADIPDTEAEATVEAIMGMIPQELDIKVKDPEIGPEYILPKISRKKKSGISLE